MSNSFARNHRIAVAILFVVLGFTCLLSCPSRSHAANSKWDEALSNIDMLYDTFLSVESSNRTVKQQIQTLRKQNNEKLKVISKEIQMIDKDLLDRLKADAESVRQKHAPLLAEYAELGKKASEARKRKDKKSALLYDLKRNRIKASVTSARQIIRQKQDALSLAKKQAAAKAKLVKDAMLGLQTLKKQITAENQMISSLNKSKTTADKRYKAAVKLGDAVTAGSELGIMVETLNQIQTSQQKILQSEQSIANILKSAEAKLPG